ncbi:MAG TPA: hypothetical protein VFW94_23650 [Candidatus Acidoferrales bacterium]|nr:hypothetical protein [Candidatus Acidoferrales bacterium]
MLRKFPSLADDQHGYAIDSGAYNNSAQVHESFRMYQTYGDGLIQHSPDWPITTDNLTDFLFSLAAYALEHPEDEELLRHLLFRLNRGPLRQAIEFCATVVWGKRDEENKSYEKRRYFSIAERKWGTHKTKQYDKRYQELTSDHDGTTKSLYRLLLPEFADGLERYLTARAIYQWTMEDSDRYMQLPGTFLKWFEGDGYDSRGNDKARALRDAFEACVAIAESWQKRQHTECHINNYKNRLEHAHEQAPETVAESDNQ